VGRRRERKRKREKRKQAEEMRGLEMQQLFFNGGGFTQNIWCISVYFNTEG
jgi:hypothetical protein